MTALEKIVVDLEMAKELQKSGIDFGETAFVWIVDPLFKNSEELSIRGEKFASRCKTIPAPTTNEIFCKIPYSICKGDFRYNFSLSHQNGDNGTEYSANFYRVDCALNPYWSEKSPEQALSQLLLWCKKEGYLK